MGDGAQMFQKVNQVYQRKHLRRQNDDDNVEGCARVGAANEKRISEIEQFHSIELNRIQMNRVDIFSSCFFECKGKSVFIFI